MFAKSILFDYNWDVDNYKSNYDPEYWDLCRTFMEVHKTKYPEKKLVSLTEAFYQIGVYGSSYDAKTTRMVSALSVEVLEKYLEAHPSALWHPFKKPPLLVSEVIDITKDDASAEDNVNKSELSQPGSRWDKPIDANIIVNVLESRHLHALFKGIVLIYDVKTTSAMNDDKASILEETFRRSKFGPLHWDKTSTLHTIWPIRLALKWKGTVLAEAMGADEQSLRVRIAQAVLCKLANFSYGIEAKWIYYRDGNVPDCFHQPNIKRSNVYKIIPHSQFRGVVEMSSFIDTFANSDTFGEVVFGMNFSTQEKTYIINHVTKYWNKKLTYRTLSKMSAKNKSYTHVCVYHIHTGDDLKRWLDRSAGENERYRVVPPQGHRRAGTLDNNVREVLQISEDTIRKENQVIENNMRNLEQKKREEEQKRQAEEAKKILEQKRKEEEEERKRKEQEKKKKEEEDRKRKQEEDKRRKEAEDKRRKEAEDKRRKEAEDKKRKEEEAKKRKQEGDRKKKEEEDKKQKEEIEKKRKEEEDKKRKAEAEKKKNEVTGNQNRQNEKCEEISGDELEKLLDGFVLFYDAKKNSEIDKDDWFSALRESFKISKFGSLEVVNENIRPMRTKCIFKLNNKILASAEGLTETQAKTAATLQLISKLEPFTYIIQAKEEYFFDGKIPPFVENPDPSKSDICRVVRRQDLPSYYTIFQTIDDFVKSKSYAEIVFGNDFSWELKNEIVVYIKAKGLDYRYFTAGDQKPWTHMAIYHIVSPDELKNYLISRGGENEKYKLIPPPKAESLITKPAEVEVAKEKPASGTPTSENAAKKRKQPEKEKEPTADESEGNKIQIKLKKFKIDKVEYPEDTGGDFPGLILFLGIKKNSTLQRSMFCILLESFKMSKFGELNVEEHEEIVWGKKEPLKKCVIKKNRKVLAVGMGETKTEAKNSASIQVLRQLRKNCYTIQSKESYFKEGKATPYNFEPEAGKENVYRLAKRNKFKDRGSIIKFVDVFSKTACNHEVIFGPDFSCEEREAILHHCRQIKVTYRLMKTQSSGKSVHTHVAIYHEKPLPTIKAALMTAGGENDKFRLIPPGGKISAQNNTDSDMWPETLENTPKETSKKPQVSGNTPSSIPTLNTSTPQKSVKNVNTNNYSNNTNNRTIRGIPTVTTTDKNQPRHNKSQEAVPVPSNYQHAGAGGYPQGNQFGPQPEFITPTALYQQPHPDMPLSFGSQAQPLVYGPEQNSFVSANIQIQTVPLESVNYGTEVPEILPQKIQDVDKKSDLREELSKKRQGENYKKSPEEKMFNVSSKRNNEENQEAWSRKVFVHEGKDSKDGKYRGKSPDLRQQLQRRDLPRERLFRSEEKINRKSFNRTARDHRENSPRRNHQETVSERAHARERERFPAWEKKEENAAFERTRDYSPTSQREHRRFIQPRDGKRFSRSQSPVMVFRDLWDNIPEDISLNMFMYKYVKQDSTTERDPISLLQATKSSKFNVDFDFIKQADRDECRVFVELITDYSNIHPLVGEGVADVMEEAKFMAANHAVSTVQKACMVIEPNYHYFADGGEPEFIRNKAPRKTHIYEIIQNMDPENPLDRYTIEVMFNMFTQSKLEDLFFLASDFSYLERMLVIDIANQTNLWWRVFGPSRLDERSDDVMADQHVCVFKQKSALQLFSELLGNGGSTDKYTLVHPRETRIIAREMQPSRRHF